MRMVKGMRVHRQTFFGFAALVLGLVSGCEGGQTGDLSGDHDDGGEATGSDGGCDVHKEKLASFDEMTDAGSANQLLDYAERSFEAPIAWKVPGQGQAWSVGPESGEGVLHVDVVHGESAYLLTYSPHREMGSGSGVDIGVLCPPAQLGVEAHVSVTTDGGALAESYDTLLRSSVPGVATFSTPFDPSKAQGTLAVSSSDPHAKLVQLSLNATLMAEGMSGSLAGLEQVESGTGPNSAVSARDAVLAVWPNTAACEGVGAGLAMPLASEALGVTGEATLASVTTDEPVSIHWHNGDVTTLTLGIESEGDGCFSVRSDVPAELGGGAGVSYPVTIVVKSADGKLDGRYPGSVVANGSGSERTVTAEAWVNMVIADAEQSGFPSVSVPTDAESLQVRVTSSSIGGVTSGSIRLVSLTSPPCMTDPTPVPSPGGSGSGTSGCAGQKQTELETASWVN
jgi:hypothetical protein